MKIGKVNQNKIWLVCSILLLSVLSLSSVFTACAQPATISDESSKGFQTVKPEDVGLSSEKLNDIDKVLEADIAANKIPGAVLLIARHGKVAYLKSFGYLDSEKKLPMQKDSIFRIYSMTKSLAAVGTAILKDQGKLAFEDPVEKYIPSFKDIQVGEVSEDENGKYVVTMVKPTTIMTIQHLATHTSGLSGMLGPKPGIAELYTQAGMNNTSGLTNAEICDKLAKLPLAENPGTLYRYGSSYDVLGRVIEVASGMTLDKFFEERIYKPLGMKDSGFLVTGEDVNRLVYLNPQWPFYMDATDPNRQPLSASFGTVSTATDWAQFAQMLLNGGELGGKRLLKPETVAYITSDLLGPLGNRNDAAYMPGRGYGGGFDFYVRVDTTNVDYPANIGEFCKEGIAGTTYSVDPKEDLLAVFMVSTTTQRQYYRSVIEKMIYHSIME
jgi:CubicO group peptidase (beta-lactamase class C family)